MRILLIDHGCCDPPRGRVHRIREELAPLGVEAAICGPSAVPGLEQERPGLHGIHLHDAAAASRQLLAAVRDGRPESFLAAVSGVPARLLGLVRETARQMIVEATDTFCPDAIFVIHAGILTDLAVETGAPVVVHVSAADLAAAAGRPSLRRLVTAAIGSCGVVVAADDATAAEVRRGWLSSAADEEGRCEAWPLHVDAAPRIRAACARAIARRMA